jgi:hypothetical protein
MYREFVCSQGKHCAAVDTADNQRPIQVGTGFESGAVVAVPTGGGQLPVRLAGLGFGAVSVLGLSRAVTHDGRRQDLDRAGVTGEV